MLLGELCTSNERIKAENYTATAIWTKDIYSQTDSMCVCGCVSGCVCECFGGGVAEDSNTGGLLDQADKGQVNAVCLLSSSRTSATQQASNTGSYQMTTTPADILQHEITSGR